MGAAAATGIEPRFRPWLTWGLLLACAISLAYTQSLESELRATAEAALDQAIEYFEQHPYLDPPLGLEQRAGSVDVDGLLSAFESDRRSRRLTPIPQAVANRQQQTLDDLVVDGLALYAKFPKYHQGLRATERLSTLWISYPLVHAGWLHLLGNGLLLLSLGTLLERVWRGALFGGLLIATAVVSGGTFALASPRLEDPLIGMVGIVAGLLGAFIVRYASIWKEPRYGLLLVGGIGWLIAPSYFGWDPSIARLMTSAPELVGHVGPSLYAIAGGFGSGMLCAIVVALVGIERKRPGAVAAFDAMSSDEVLDEARDAREQGRLEEAHARLASLVRAEPNNRDALLAIWEVAFELGRRKNAAAALARIVELEIRSGSKEGAIEHWFELVSHGLEGQARPALSIRIALLLAAAGRNSDAVHAFEVALRGAEGENAATVAARVARAARDIDTAIAEDAAWRALAVPGLAIEERQGLEALLAQLGTRPGEAAARIVSGCRVEESNEWDDEMVIDASVTESGRPAHDPAQALAQNPFAGGDFQTAPEPASPMVQWEDSELMEDASELDEPMPLVAESDESFVAEHVDEHVDDDADSALRPSSIAFEFISRKLEVVDAVPTELSDAGLTIELEGGVKKRITYDRIEAICAVAISGSGKPVLLVDLILNWNAGSEQVLKAVRLRGDRFDPRRLVSTDSAPLDAMRTVIGQLLTHTGAIPLPDLDSVRGYPFASFADVASYESSILSVESLPSEDIE